MKEVNIKELEIGDILKIWWGFFWRGIAIGIGSMLSGAVAGGIFGAIAGAVISIVGGGQETIIAIARLGGSVLGVVIGFYFFYLYLLWILKSRFGKYRLALIKNEEEASLIT